MNTSELNSIRHKEPSIGQEVAANHHKAIVFKRYGIDFCCGGKKTLSQACAEQNLDYTAIRKDLDAAEALNQGATHEFDSWAAPDLANYIESTHHRYVEQHIPPLLEFTRKIAKVHGARHPELLQIESLFRELADELTTHMKKEELILFPFIRKIFATVSAPVKNGPLLPHGIEAPIRMMELEHESAGTLLKQIRLLSSDYIPPADACSTYRVAFSLLLEFEEDLHRHIHLENNILFPKSLARAQNISGN